MDHRIQEYGRGAIHGKWVIRLKIGATKATWHTGADKTRMGAKRIETSYLGIYRMGYIYNRNMDGHYII
jgi:hypothetical protein